MRRYGVVYRESLYESPKSFLESVHREDRERLLRAIEEHQERQWSCEYRIVRPDGTIRWIHDRGYPILDERGNLRLRTGVSTDITERKKAEKDLLESRERLQIVLDTIPAAVFWKDSDSVYVGANRAWLVAAGLTSSQEVVGKTDYDLPWEKESGGFLSGARQEGYRIGYSRI